jgi:hypothetical protein
MPRRHRTGGVRRRPEPLGDDPELPPALRTVLADWVSENRDEAALLIG